MFLIVLKKNITLITVHDNIIIIIIIIIIVIIIMA